MTGYALPIGSAVSAQHQAGPPDRVSDEIPSKDDLERQERIELSDRDQDAAGKGNDRSFDHGQGKEHGVGMARQKEL